MTDARGRRLLGHVAVLGLYLALSAAWSWPTAAFDPTVLVTRHFDLYPAIWLLHHAPDTFPGLATDQTGYPYGETLARADSYVWYGLGALSGRLLAPATLAAVLTVIGPALGAFAAERCAGDGFGVPRPWSLFAGVAYGFAGVGTVALLEGHVFHLLHPWLPALWWAWARDRPLAGGLAVGLAFAGALFTSAYFGLLAVVLLAALAAADARRALRHAPAVALVALPAGLWYLRLFEAGGRFGDGEPLATERFLRMGTVSLSGLAGWSPGVDEAHHALAAPLGFTTLFLLVLAPVVLRGASGWRGPWALAWLSIPVALGRTVRLEEGVELVDWPLDALVALPGMAFFRFPLRGLWLWALVGGVVGARVLAALVAEARPAWGGGVLAAATLEMVAAPALACRLDRVPAAAPSAYAAAPADRPVLDLFGRPVDHSGGEVEMWARNLGCYYQVHHRRPLLEVCIGTAVDSPREVAQRFLFRRLDRPDAYQRLAELGVGALAVHLDFFTAADGAYLEAALTRALGPPVASDDGGERLLVYVLPATPGADRRAAWAIVARGGE